MKNPQKLYQDLILEHSRHPRNYGRLEEYTHQAEEANPICGDEIRLTARIGENAQLQDIRFEGRGCALCLASASMMTDMAAGKSVEDIRKLIDTIMSVFGNGVSSGAARTLPGSFAVFREVLNYPVRVKCVLLGWRALDALITRFSETERL